MENAFSNSVCGWQCLWDGYINYHENCQMTQLSKIDYLIKFKTCLEVKFYLTESRNTQSTAYSQLNSDKQGKTDVCLCVNDRNPQKTWAAHILNNKINYCQMGILDEQSPTFLRIETVLLPEFLKSRTNKGERRP